MTTVAGVDGGATKTMCIIADDAGKFYGFGVAGGSNYLAVGLANASREIGSAFSRAAVSLPRKKVDIICLALAGAAREEDKAVIRQAAEELDIAERIVVENDAIAALYGATGGSAGVVVVAGTGSISYGMKGDDIVRAGGYGHIMSDEGSGYRIAVDALSAAFRSCDGRGKKTALEHMIPEWIGVGTLDEVVEKVYKEMGKKEIADLCYYVKETAYEGDGVAAEIVETAGKDLGLLASAVIRRLHMEDEAVRVVPVGGVFKTRGQLITHPMISTVRECAPNAYLGKPLYDSVLGAVLLATKELGITIEKEKLDRIQGELKEIEGKAT